MNLFQRLLHSQQQSFTPIPGSFPGEVEESANTRPAANELHNNERGPRIKKWLSFNGLLRILLYSPLLVLYYVLNILLTLCNSLRPLHRTSRFYDKKRRRSSDHGDELATLIESLARNSGSVDTGNAQDDRTGSGVAYSFSSLYNLEDGSLLPQVVQGGYTCLLQACSEQGKFAMIYLHDALLDDPMEYVRTLLCSEQFTVLVKKYQVLLWFGDVTTSEGLQVANSLKVRQFPFLGLLSLKNESKLELVGRVEGKLYDYSLEAMESKMARHYPHLIALRQQRQNIELQRLMREQQDLRYQESLTRDQERERQRQEAQARHIQRNREAELKKQWLLWRKSRLSPEATGEGVCRVAIRLENGGRIVRKFDAGLPIEEIYAYVELYQSGLLDGAEVFTGSTEPSYDHRYPFRLTTPVPRVVLDQTKTISEETAIYPSGNIVMEALD